MSLRSGLCSPMALVLPAAHLSPCCRPAPVAITVTCGLGSGQAVGEVVLTLETPQHLWKKTVEARSDCM